MSHSQPAPGAQRWIVRQLNRRGLAPAVFAVLATLTVAVAAGLRASAEAEARERLAGIAAGVESLIAELHGADGAPLAEVSVADQGPGIPEAELEAVFDPFIQSSRTRTAAGSSGLGLAICRELVRGHGGDIRATNHPGGGATIRFTLPRHAPQPRLAREEAA
jgi:signal transduction histidine kinase